MLERFDKDKIELIIDTETGESFATAAGYARMSGVKYDTIKKRVQQYNRTGEISKLKIAEIPTTQGLRQGILIPGKIALSWLSTDNPKLLAAMAEIGWNVYCHKLAGFEISSTAIQQPVIDPTMQLMFSEMALIKNLLTEQIGELKLEKEQLKLEKEELKIEKEELKTENKLLEGKNEFLEIQVEEFEENEKELQRVFKKVPGLEKAIEAIRKSNPENQETITLKEFCEKYNHNHLTRGQRISIGKTVAGFARLANLESLTKAVTGQTLYPICFVSLIALAVGVETGLFDVR